MNKGRVLLLLVILCTTFFVNKEGISARWVVRAGYGDYVERVCENGIVFNYFHDAYGGTIDWDHNPFGNEWVSRKVESCENGTCEELSVISATVGDGEADLTLGPNYVADFWVLRWSDDVPLGSTITVTLEWDEDSDFITGGVVEECSLPERAPSLFSFCSQTQHLGSKVTLNTPNIKIFDLEMTLATSSVYSSTFSTNLTSPNGTSIKLLDNFSRPPELYGYKCLQEANFNSADGSEVVIWSDSGIDPYDPFDPKPQVPLANFNGITTAGNWQLNFENLNGNPFTVNLDCWCLYMVGTPVNTTYLPLTTGGTQSTSANNPPNVPSNPSHNSSVTLEEFDNRTVSLQWNGGDPNGDNVTYDVYVEANDPTPDVLLAAALQMPNVT
ncbi:MAG: hypothetical protein H6657_07315 [Ardenticatenaceae bacterium]|nr:hypothetical protein [Ardenticatenaceae bacterium]